MFWVCNKRNWLDLQFLKQPSSRVIYRWGTLCMRIWNTGQQNTLIKILMEIPICKEANFLFVCLFVWQIFRDPLTILPGSLVLVSCRMWSDYLKVKCSFCIMCTYYAFQIIFLSVIIAWNAKLAFHEYFLCLDFRHPVCVDVEHAWKEAFLNMQQRPERICIVQELWVPQT